MDGNAVAPSNDGNGKWVAERTTYNFGVAGNKSLAVAMMSIARDFKYDVNLDNFSPFGPATEERGPTLLHVFARNGWGDLVIDLVTNRGVHVDAITGTGLWFTPLFHALAAGQFEVAELLVKLGADPTLGGNPYGIIHALVGLEGEKFDIGLNIILRAIAGKSVGLKGICRAIYHVAEWFEEVSRNCPGKLVDKSPLFDSIKNSYRGTLMSMANATKDDWDKFCQLLWRISGSSEPPMILAAKAGSLRAVLFFAAVGFHEGVLQYGSAGRTVLMETSAAMATNDQLKLARLLSIAKALLAIVKVDPNHRVPAEKRSGKDVGKTAVHFVAAKTCAGAAMPLANLLVAYGADTAIGADGPNGLVFPRDLANMRGLGDLTRFLDEKSKWVRPNSFQLG